MAYDFNVPHNKISKGLKKGSVDSQPVANTPNNDGIRDMFLHALFARIARNDDSVTEFETKFFPEENLIELDIPESTLSFLETVEQGDNFRRFIVWLAEAVDCANCPSVFIFPPSDGDPDDGETGDMYYNTELNDLMLRDDELGKWLSSESIIINVSL